MLWFFIIFILLIVTFAFYIDRRRKRNNNNPHIPTNPNTKPGDSSNYMMGDNKDTGGFQ
jgi:preprotein translocase subunit YajC